MDGVRQNQPFGDIVAWDLIPKIAISEVALMPGSNPLFGLNTLGGAISIQTKDGHSQPGTTLQFSGGSFGRRAGEFEHGGSNFQGAELVCRGQLFREDGWRVNLALGGAAGVRESWDGRTARRHIAQLRLRGQLADGQWSAGHALSRSALFERVQRFPTSRGTVPVVEPEPAAQPHQQSDAYRATLIFATSARTRRMAIINENSFDRDRSTI